MIHASEIDRSDVEWLNTDRPLSLATLKGRLVLLDFWTFCCVNCLHIIPLLRDLARRFANKLVVIGIHSPKFAHERACTADQRLLVVDTNNHRVIEYNIDTQETVTWSPTALGPEADRQVGAC